MSEELKEKALEMIWKEDIRPVKAANEIADIMVKFYLELTNE